MVAAVEVGVDVWGTFGGTGGSSQRESIDDNVMGGVCFLTNKPKQHGKQRWNTRG